MWPFGDKLLRFRQFICKNELVYHKKIKPIEDIKWIGWIEVITIYEWYMHGIYIYIIIYLYSWGDCVGEKIYIWLYFELYLFGNFLNF